MGRIVQQDYIMQHPESNVTFKRTPRKKRAAAPHSSACMSGSSKISTPMTDSSLACHKRKPPAGVTLNFIR